MDTKKRFFLTGYHNTILNSFIDYRESSHLFPLNTNAFCFFAHLVVVKERNNPIFFFILTPHLSFGKTRVVYEIATVSHLLILFSFPLELKI